MVLLEVTLLALPAVAQTTNGGGDGLVPQASGAAQSPKARLTAGAGEQQNALGSKLL